MRILYIGQGANERTTAFTSFLGARFDAVRTALVTELPHLDFTDVDVAVVDGEPLKGEQPPSELATSDLPVPTVLVGGVGGKVGDAIGLKLGWRYGCLCLDHRAIITEDSTTHPIFSGPVPVPPPITERIASPDNFLHYSATKDVPEKVAVAEIFAGAAVPTEEQALALQERMQAAMAAGDADAIRAIILERPTSGLVSTSSGFFDSPDTEHILGGINQKAHDYVAVGRQGRFLQWGFHGDPTVMTDLGQALFTNAIHYIAGFSDAPVECLRVQWTREMLHQTLGFLDQLEPEGRDARLAGNFGGTAPEGLGTSTASALSWWESNGGFIRRIGSGHQGHYELDNDLVALGLANNDPRLLDELARTLDVAGPEGDRARLLWSRYVRRDPSDATLERAWLEAHRGALFFSDWAGYRWIARNELPELVVPRFGLVSDGPVSLTLMASRDGDDLELELLLSVKPGFYLYAPGAADGLPVTVELAGGDSHTLVAGPVFPDTPDRHLTGTVQLPLRVRGADDAVALDVRVQVCDEQSCTPPTTLTVRAVAGR
jgi:hypothetical protein